MQRDMSVTLQGGRPADHVGAMVTWTVGEMMDMKAVEIRPHTMDYSLGKVYGVFRRAFQGACPGGYTRAGIEQGQGRQLTLASTRQFHICAALYQATAFGDATLILN